MIHSAPAADWPCSMIALNCTASPIQQSNAIAAASARPTPDDVPIALSSRSTRYARGAPNATAPDGEWVPIEPRCSLRRLNHLDRKPELLELRPDLGRVADDDPGEALRVDHLARRIVEAGLRLGAIF